MWNVGRSFEGVPLTACLLDADDLGLGGNLFLFRQGYRGLRLVFLDDGLLNRLGICGCCWCDDYDLFRLGHGVLLGLMLVNRQWWTLVGEGARLLAAVVPARSHYFRTTDVLHVDPLKR